MGEAVEGDMIGEEMEEFDVRSIQHILDREIVQGQDLDALRRQSFDHLRSLLNFYEKARNPKDLETEIEYLSTKVTALSLENIELRQRLGEIECQTPAAKPSTSPQSEAEGTKEDSRYVEVERINQLLRERVKELEGHIYALSSKFFIMHAQLSELHRQVNNPPSKEHQRMTVLLPKTPRKQEEKETNRKSKRMTEKISRSSSALQLPSRKLKEGSSEQEKAKVTETTAEKVNVEVTTRWSRSNPFGQDLKVETIRIKDPDEFSETTPPPTSKSTPTSPEISRAVRINLPPSNANSNGPPSPDSQVDGKVPPPKVIPNALFTTWEPPVMPSSSEERELKEDGETTKEVDKSDREVIFAVRRFELTRENDTPSAPVTNLNDSETFLYFAEEDTSNQMLQIGPDGMSVTDRSAIPEKILLFITWNDVKQISYSPSGNLLSCEFKEKAKDGDGDVSVVASMETEHGQEIVRMFTEYYKDVKHKSKEKLKRKGSFLRLMSTRSRSFSSKGDKKSQD